MYIKPLKNGKFIVVPDMATFDTKAIAQDYIMTKSKSL